MRTHGRIEVLAERTKIPSDGRSSSRICVRFPQPPGEAVEFKLSRRGSFAPDETVREATFPVDNNEVNFTVYSSKRPGTAFLTSENIKYRIDFVPASMMQAIWHEWVPTVFFALVFAWIIRSFVVASYYIPSRSMESTLLEHDLLIADKFSYRVLGHEPQRGDVMIFRYPNNEKQDFIKRVIGLPGDTIEVREGVVYANRIPLEEPYIKEQPFRDFGPKTIGKDEYFVMGDNRNQSHDSRYWGTVPRENLEGRALFVFWPPQRAKIIDTPDAAAYASELPAGH